MPTNLMLPPDHFELASDRCDLMLEPPLPCQASRNNPFPSDDRRDWSQMKVSTSSSTSMLVDIFDNRIKVAESNIEANAFLVMRSDPGILDIQDQPASMPWIDANGTERDHTLDFSALCADGTVKAIYAKNASSLQRRVSEGVIELLRSQVPNGSADKFVTVSEEDMPSWHIRNCQLLTSVQDDSLTWIDDDLREHVATLREPISIHLLGLPFGGGKYAFRPIARLIQNGTLKQLEPGLIDETTIVVCITNQEAAHA